ncbi:AraC family transcriptional regulator [Mesorhizobium sp. CA16]|uniref:AraC family transcriptional regulator n=1 Tax=Mesorhizobium sp. CA16 TaxID=588496 RepID=UPI001CCB6840|nr:AraC family transcriptional regulator [Mesorhizobium sp. CA16]MBZ9915596.1 AraC family transcriptional regulator [Mesorhizobium sp. CA16]
MHRIIYNSSDLIGGEQIQKEQWISTLSSGYARLRADPAVGRSFEGELRIVRTCDVSVGTIHGTVKSISRTTEDIVAQSTNNVVLLLNAGHSALSVDQSGRSVDLSPGASVLVEQSAPSIIRVSDGQCGLIAVQTDRERVHQRCAGFEDRLMTAVSSSMMINALVRAYVGVLAHEKEAESQLTMQFVADHIADLIAATASPTAPVTADDNADARGLRAVRTQAILTKIRSGFTDPEISAQGIAKELRLSTRYIHDILQETGISFSERVLELRLQSAHKMLAQRHKDGMRVSEIAMMSGFSDVSYFNRCFRRRFGYTPTSAR